MEEWSMRLVPIILLCLLTFATAQAFAPRAAYWTAGEYHYLAALAGERLSLSHTQAGGVLELARIPAAGITTICIAPWHGAPALLAARGKSLLRLDPAKRRWALLGSAPAPIREIHPTPDGTAQALLLTGSSENPANNHGAVYRVDWRGTFICARVTAVKETYHPWQLWWTRGNGEQRFAAATYKATPYAKFPHNCLFIFAWQDGAAEARWLGSRLSRPYVDAAHADLRNDGQWRMIAVEITQEGGRGLDVYRPIGFGYEGEWRSETIPGLERVTTFGTTVLCWGRDAGGKPVAWRLLPQAEGYRLVALPKVPPVLELVTSMEAGTLAGWWEGVWHIIPAPAE
jgi:hypothetical protein